MNNYEKENIRKLHIHLAHARGILKTYCPSEVARIFYKNNWRDHLNIVREVADELVSENILVTIQKKNIIREKPSEAKGPIRLRLK